MCQCRRPGLLGCRRVQVAGRITALQGQFLGFKWRCRDEYGRKSPLVVLRYKCNTEGGFSTHYFNSEDLDSIFGTAAPERGADMGAAWSRRPVASQYLMRGECNEIYYSRSTHAILHRKLIVSLTSEVRARKKLLSYTIERFIKPILEPFEKIEISSLASKRL